MSALSPSSERKCGEGQGEGAPDMEALGGGGRGSGKCVLEQRGQRGDGQLTRDVGPCGHRQQAGRYST